MRKKKTIIEENLPDSSTVANEQGDPLLDTDNAAPDEMLDAIFDNFGQTPYVIKVYRHENGSRRFSFKTTTRIDESYIQDQFPRGGKFEVCITVNGEPLRPVVLDIDPKPLTHTQNGDARNGSNGNDQIYQFMIESLREEVRHSREMVIRMLESRVDNHGSSELIAAMQGLKALSGGDDKIDTLMKGFELAGKMNGSG